MLKSDKSLKEDAIYNVKSKKIWQLNKNNYNLLQQNRLVQ